MKKNMIYLLMLLFIQNISAQEFVKNEKGDIINDLSNLFKEWYLDESMALTMSKALLANQEQGKYDNHRSRSEFIKQVVSDLRLLSNDLHIQMHFVSPKVEAQKETEVVRPTFGGDERGTGISRVAVLPGKIGRIKFTLFSPSGQAKKEITEAFKRFKKEGVKAIVIDLRECRGGNGDMTRWVMSHFLPVEPVFISTLENRKMKIKKEKWSLDEEHIGRDMRFDQPLYILTSGETFSGGESFAYSLKHLGRATLVGEKTGGGANMVTRMQLIVEDEQGVEAGYYQLLMPFIKSTNAKTGTNWEGVGVIPHIKTVADDAWEMAYELATSN